jgi:integrase/recombinase XerD
MPTKLSTTVSKIGLLPNEENVKLVLKFHEFMKENSASERHQNNNLKAIMAFSNYLGKTSIKDINKKEDVLSFLQSKIKDKELDQEQKWITTYNDYLHRIKHFYRWLYNVNDNTEEISMDLWKTPAFIESLKPKKTKRLSPYSETEIWEKDEFLALIKYEQFQRNKAALALLWDLDARPHEITLLKIKHIRLKEKYGEGEIPHQAKTGSGPVLLTCSFPYVRDWLNQHPFKGESNARLICNLLNGAPIKPEALHTMMTQLKKRITRLIDTGEIKGEEREKMLYILSNKRFNPYCIRHSAITSDSDYLPEYALKKKVRWSMNSRQGSRYIKTRMGNELKNKILAYNGIISENEIIRKPSILTCPRCEFVNVIENKYCSKCSYPLKPDAYDELKANEDQKFTQLQQKHEKDLSNLKEEMNSKFTQIITLIQQNPILANVKPEVLQNTPIRNL